METGDDNGTSEEGLTVEDAAAQLLDMLPDEDEAGEQRDAGAPPKPAADPDPAASDDELDLEEGDGTPPEPGESTDEGDEPPAKPKEDPPQPRTLKVKVDGEDLEVTEDEAAKGYSRTADYTRKTQALADARRKFEEEEVAPVRAERQAYAASLADLRQVLEQATNTEPDWEKLRNESPETFPAAFAEWQINQERLNRVRQEEANVHAKMAADAAQARKAYLAEERTKLTQAIPGWEKTETATAELKDITQYAMSQGYSREDVGSVVDHRVVVLLRKAMLYDRAVAKRTAAPAKPAAATPAAAAPRAMKPGASAAVTKAGEKPTLAAAKRKLSASGDVKDAAAAIEMLLGD